MSAAASPATRPLQLNPEFDHYSYPAAVSIDAHSGHPGHTTDQQDAIVVVFRGRLLSAEPGFKEELRASNFQGDVDSVGYRKRLDTLTLLRFLRATKWIVDDAVKKYVLEIMMFYSCSALRLIGQIRFESSSQLLAFFFCAYMSSSVLCPEDVSTNIYF